ncbi:MAG: hypothetical protein AAFX94_25150, partial [Myxococcota bacterium]
MAGMGGITGSNAMESIRRADGSEPTVEGNDVFTEPGSAQVSSLADRLENANESLGRAEDQNSSDVFTEGNSDSTSDQHLGAATQGAGGALTRPSGRVRGALPQ